VDTWAAEHNQHNVVPGRGARESSLFCSGSYGEAPGYEFHRPVKYDEDAIEILRTGRKMKVRFGVDKDDRRRAAQVGEKRKRSGLKKEVKVSVWDLMENAKIKVEKKEDEPRGWREEDAD
jgi:hypothetical protein